MRGPSRHPRSGSPWSRWRSATPSFWPETQYWLPAFGDGIHYCLGAPLARMEGRIALRSLLERCPGLALDARRDELEWLPGALLRGVRRLPVVGELVPAGAPPRRRTEQNRPSGHRPPHDDLTLADLTGILEASRTVEGASPDVLRPEAQLDYVRMVFTRDPVERRAQGATADALALEAVVDHEPHDAVPLVRATHFHRVEEHEANELGTMMDDPGLRLGMDVCLRQRPDVRRHETLLVRVNPQREARVEILCGDRAQLHYVGQRDT